MAPGVLLVRRRRGGRLVLRGAALVVLPARRGVRGPRRRARPRPDAAAARVAGACTSPRRRTVGPVARRAWGTPPRQVPHVSGTAGGTHRLRIAQHHSVAPRRRRPMGASAPHTAREAMSNASAGATAGRRAPAWRACRNEQQQKKPAAKKSRRRPRLPPPGGAAEASAVVAAGRGGGGHHR